MTKCDFCNCDHPKWEYTARAFAIAVPILNAVWGSEGSWAACDACRSMIERGDHVGLLATAIATSGIPRGQDAVLDQAIEDAMRLLHSAFRERRLGPARPIASA